MAGKIFQKEKRQGGKFLNLGQSDCAGTLGDRTVDRGSIVNFRHTGDCVLKPLGRRPHDGFSRRHHGLPTSASTRSQWSLTLLRAAKSGSSDGYRMAISVKARIFSKAFSARI